MIGKYSFIGIKTSCPVAAILHFSSLFLGFSIKMSFVPLQRPSLGQRFRISIRGIPFFREIMCATGNNDKTRVLIVSTSILVGRFG